MRKFRSHGTGEFSTNEFSQLGAGVVFEAGVKVWHPETIRLGDNVYIGHDAMLKGYYSSSLTIGNDTWVGQGVFIHSAGQVNIGDAVGIGPFVKILTSSHRIPLDQETAILDAPLDFAPVSIGAGSDIGVGAIILPGVTIGRGAQIGAGSVVTRDVAEFSIVAGNPAKLLRVRTP